MEAKECPDRQHLLDKIAKLQREFDIFDAIDDALNNYTADSVENLCRAADALDAAKEELAAFDNAPKK
jgi:hypothetical protein